MTLEIFVPYWGDPRLLQAAIQSVRAQRNPGWRLTVIDDCYPDTSVRNWLTNDVDDPRIAYIRNAKNVGITENYREAVRRATSPFITILGSDDLLHPNYVDVIERTIAAVPTADVVQPGVQVIGADGSKIQPLADIVKQRVLAPRGGSGIAVLRGEKMATSLIRGDWLYWPALTFRTETMRRIDFREGMPIIQDLALLMDIAFAHGTLAYNPELAFSYRRHGDSASQRTLVDGTRFRDERRYYAEATRLADARGWRRTKRAARLRIMSRLHAMSELPHLLGSRNRAGLESVVAHIVAP